MDDYVLDARVEHVRNFVHILTAVKLSRKQHARVSVGERGLTIVSLDDSKSLQAQANFRAEVFRAYDVNLAAASHHHHAGTRRAGVSSHAATFALALGPLIDVLSAFALSTARLSCRFAGPTATAASSSPRPRRARRPGPPPARMHARRRLARNSHGGDRRRRRHRLPRRAKRLHPADDDAARDRRRPRLARRARRTRDARPPDRPPRVRLRGQGHRRAQDDVDATGAGSRLSEFHCGEPGRWTYRHRFQSRRERADTAVRRRRRRMGTPRRR